MEGSVTPRGCVQAAVQKQTQACGAYQRYEPSRHHHASVSQRFCYRVFCEVVTPNHGDRVCSAGALHSERRIL